MASVEKTIYVYADWAGQLPALIGRLYINENRGKELASFEYNKDWIRTSDAGFYSSKRCIAETGS